MKKFIALALGLVLVGTSVITLSDASRDAYQAYLYQQALKNRAERRFSEGKIVRPTYTQETHDNSAHPSLLNLRYPQNKRNLFGAAEKESSNLKLRPMSNASGLPASHAQNSRQTLTIRNIDPMQLLVKTVATENFSVQIPQGWNPQVTDGVLTVGNEDTLSVTIKKIDNACESLGFQACAITLSNDLNRLQNVGEKITSLGHVARLRQDTDRILGTNRYVNTHTESFLGSYLGNEVFISRYFIGEEGTNNVFLIETIAKRSFASEAVVIAKQLSSSFRMILN